MKKLLFGVFLIIFSILSLNETVKAQDSIAVTEKNHKNEFGLNFAPIAIVVMGGTPGYESNFALTYRHFINKRSAIRIRPSISFFNNQSWNTGEIISLTDSTKVTEFKNTDNHASPALNIGYEIHWGKKKIKWFMGCDMFYKYKKEDYYINHTYMSRDSAAIASGGNYNKIDSLDYERTSGTSTHSFGISALIGIRFDINERWAVTANSALSLGLGFTDQNIFYNNQIVNKEEWTNLDFEMIGLLSDVSLIFKF